jgi:tetratricopeptide (TPR) repeat protein
LFIARARAVVPDFTPTDAEAGDLGEIARLLDGIPLAIELCAARVATFDTRTLRARLDHAPSILDRAPRGAGPRKTVSGAIAWSWSLLDPAHRRALAWSATFRSSFTLAAAAAVLEPILGGTSIDDVIEGLVERSLVRARPGGNYALFHVVRAFAEERLIESGEADAAFARHADVLLANAEAELRRLGTKESMEARASLIALHDDLLAIHARALATEKESAVRAAIAVQPVLHARGPMTLRLSIVDSALPLTRDASRERAWLEFHRGVALVTMGRTAEARDQLATAARTAHAANVPEVELRAHLRRADCEALLGNANADRQAIDDAAVVAERSGDPWSLASVSATRGRHAWTRGRRDDGDPYVLAAADGFARAGDVTRGTQQHSSIGVQALVSGRLELAVSHLTHAKNEYARLGLQRDEARVAGDLAIALFELGRVEEARATFRFSLDGSRRVGHTRALGWHLCYAGIFELESGNERAAHALLEESIAIFREMGDFGMIGIQIAAFAGSLAARACLSTNATSSVLPWFDELRAAEDALQRADDLTDPRAAVRALSEARERIARDGLREPERPAAIALETRLAARLLSRRAADIERRLTAQLSMPNQLEVCADARWFSRNGGPRVDLDRVVAPRRMLERLLGEHQRAPGAPLSLDDLFAAGWPDQRAVREAMTNRVNVALNKLRTLGLRDVVLSRDGGWLLDPGVNVIRRT